MIQRPASARRVVSGLALLGVLPVLAGCGLESKDYTSGERATVQAASDQIGGVLVRNAFITVAPSASGKLQAYLLVSLVNDGSQPDTLTGITTSLGTVTISGGDPVTGGVQLAPGVAVQLSDPSIDSSRPSAVISTTSDPTTGTTASVTFTFAIAGQTKPLSVPVVTTTDTLSPNAPVPTDVATPPAETAPSSSD